MTVAHDVKSAIILAGGKGERLRPYTNDRPKPMVEVGGHPILEYQLVQLKAAGIKGVVFACSYQRHTLQDYVGDGSRYGMKVAYSVEETPLGRGGAIKQAMGYLPGGWQTVLVLNGDNLWQIDLPRMIKQHQETDALVTMVVSPLKSPYGIIEFDEDKRVLNFREKPVLPHWLNSGVYLLNKDLEPMLPDVGDHETETFPKLPKETFFVFPSAGYWRGVDTVKDLNEAGKELADIFPKVSFA